MLKSELSEKEFLINKLRLEKTLTKKEWLKEEAFENINKELLDLKKAVLNHKKDSEHWQNQYFKLFNQVK